MSEIGSGDPTNWPTAQDTNTIKESGATQATSNFANDVADRIIKLMNILGNDPHGGPSGAVDVAARIGAEHTLLGLHSSIPSFLATGTVMCFFQASAPSGWTLITTQNDKVLRVVSATGGGAAGSWATSSGVPVIATHDHTSPSHLHTITHTHSVPRDGWGEDSLASGRISTTQTGSFQASNDNTTGASSSANTGSTAPSNTGTAGAVLAQVPAYIDVILASKD